MVQSPAVTHPRPAQFVRLSQLRKLREREQVAAVCYRVRRGDIKFLLVRTRGSGRWIFPKGSAEPGLTHAQAAALEAFEEAGVHGRIEELPFAQYARCKLGDARNSAKRSEGKELAVNAHLCEVLRLSPPQEPRRDRTWFSVEDAKLRLQEGRKRSDGVGLSRVLDKAVARIRRLRGGSGIVDQSLDQPQEVRPRADTLQKDALQKVQFDFAEAYGRVEQASFKPHIRRQLGDMRELSAPIAGVHRREVLQGEVLEFGPPRQKRSKALGTGARNG